MNTQNLENERATTCVECLVVLVLKTTVITHLYELILKVPKVLGAKRNLPQEPNSHLHPAPRWLWAYLLLLRGTSEKQLLCTTGGSAGQCAKAVC